MQRPVRTGAVGRLLPHCSPLYLGEQDKQVEMNDRLSFLGTVNTPLDKALTLSKPISLTYKMGRLMPIP